MIVAILIFSLIWASGWYLIGHSIAGRDMIRLVWLALTGQDREIRL